MASFGHVPRLEPASVRPSQLSPAICVTLPEHRLMLAVLAHAVREFQMYATATHPRGRRLFRESERWLRSNAD